MGNGNGTFQPERILSFGVPNASVAVGDFNGDGHLDIAATNSVAGNNSVSVFLGRGDGSFQSSRNFPVGGQPRFVTSVDCNGDGVLDLVVISGGTVRVLRGQGDGSFQSTNASYVAGADPTFVAAADLAGSGRTDLVVANSGSNNVSLLFNDGGCGGGGAPGRQPSHRPHSKAVFPLPDRGLSGGPGNFATTVPPTPARADLPAAESVPAPPPAAREETSWTVAWLDGLERHLLQRRLLAAGEEPPPEEGLTDLPL
jgi:hypothetical protein